jgi:hypothetical protein
VQLVGAATVCWTGVRKWVMGILFVSSFSKSDVDSDFRITKQTNDWSMPVAVLFAFYLFVQAH